jgi:radical SAM protein with 4Fe4S-binding SPASM domain
MKTKTLSTISACKKLFAPGVQKPIYLLNFVTNSCNAACEHCFYWEELNTKKHLELSVEEHSKVAKSLGSMLQVTFTGGSPELRKDLPDIVYEYYKYCRPGNMTFCMLGYNTERIKEHVEKMLIRCKGQQITIGISLDGLGEEHDEYRKLKGLFDRVVKTIHELHKLQSHYPNLKTGIGMVVHGLNTHKVEQTALWVRKNLPVDILKPILVRGNPFNPDTRSEECIDVYNRIVDRDRQWLMENTEGSLSFKNKVIRAKENVQRNLIKEISVTKKTQITCSGGRETAVMYPSGDIAGCEMRSNVLGNIRDLEYNFEKAWFSASAKEFRKTTGEADECIGCYHHCFISPAMFRTPSIWPKIAKSILELNAK